MPLSRSSSSVKFIEGLRCRSFHSPVGRLLLRSPPAAPVAGSSALHLPGIFQLNDAPALPATTEMVPHPITVPEKSPASDILPGSCNGVIKGFQMVPISTFSRGWNAALATSLRTSSVPGSERFPARIFAELGDDQQAR